MGTVLIMQIIAKTIMQYPPNDVHAVIASLARMGFDVERPTKETER